MQVCVKTVTGNAVTLEDQPIFVKTLEDRPIFEEGILPARRCKRQRSTAPALHGAIRVCPAGAIPPAVSAFRRAFDNVKAKIQDKEGSLCTYCGRVYGNEIIPFARCWFCDASPANHHGR